MLISSVANGLGNPLPALLMTITRLLLVYLPLVWLLPHWFGLDGLFIAAAAANVLVGLGALVWVKRKFRRGKNTRKAERRRKAMWEERYEGNHYLFGTEPNNFLRENSKGLPIGETLSLGEGEGKNAVFLAGLGHQVTALDASENALLKAKQLAQQKRVRVNTLQTNLYDYQFEAGRWDCIVAIFCHLPSSIRKRVHQQIAHALRPGGVFILEAYTPEQLQYGSGGPPVKALTMELAELRKELAALKMIHAVELTRHIHEGEIRHGKSAVVQVIASKKAK